MAARINELRQRRAEAKKALGELLEAQLTAAGPTGRTFTAEEVAAAAAAEEVVTNLDALIAAEERRLKADTPTAEQVAVREPNAAQDPRKGFRNPREFLEACIANSGLRDRSQVSDERLKLVATSDKEDKKSGGELVYMLPEAFTPASLRPMATVGSDEQGAYSDPHGGYSVRSTLLPGMLQLGFEGDPTAGRTQAVPMATPMVEILARTDKDHTTSVSGGFTVARRAEAAAAVQSRGQMEMVTLKASSLFGLAFATEEILSDSVISFLAFIEAGFRDQFSHRILSEKIRGGGGDEFLGILTALSSASPTSLGPTIAVAKEGGQAADTIVLKNVQKMRARAWGYQNSIWLANHDTYPELASLQLAVGTGGAAVYQPSVVEDRPDMLLGRPIFYSEYPSTLGDAGDLILGNWSQFLEGVYQPLMSAESIHVRFVNHERALKFWLRNAGAPWWRTPLTPHKGANTLSPFVIIAERA